MSLVVPIRDSPGEFLISHGRDIVHIKWDHSNSNSLTQTVLVSVDSQAPGNRFNDGKCDARGRLWAGTMEIVKDESRPGDISMHGAALYRIDDRGVVKILDEVFKLNA